MGQTVTANISGYNVNIVPLYVDAQDRSVEVVGVLVDSNGNKIGEVDTDICVFARNLPIALVKAYLLNRKILNGTLVPDTYL